MYFDQEVTDKVSKYIPGQIVDIEKDGLLVSTKDYLIKILELKVEGKKKCTSKEYLNGIKNKDELIGKVFMNK